MTLATRVDHSPSKAQAAPATEPEASPAEPIQEPRPGEQSQKHEPRIAKSAPFGRLVRDSANPRNTDSNNFSADADNHPPVPLSVESPLVAIDVAPLSTLRATRRSLASASSAAAAASASVAPVEANTASPPLFSSRKRSASRMLGWAADNTKSRTPTEPAEEDVDMAPQRPLMRNGDDDEEESSTAQRLCDVTQDSPSSPGTHYKRMRSSADSDAGSSSCKDMDELEVFAPDSVPALVAQLRGLLDYVASKPTLQHGSASFMRDYLRTMLIQNSVMAEEAIQTASRLHKAEVVAGRARSNNECFKTIPDELAKHIFGFLDGHNLARAREVCRRWNVFACEEPLWKALCLRRWRSLETDQDLWKLIDKNVDPTAPNRWFKIFPKVNESEQWRCRLQKTGRFICNLIAHHISGEPLGKQGLPSTMIVERRFNILHLQQFVLPNASVLYFEPESESDREGFDDFIDYLNRRTRAGLALDDPRRFIFIPVCVYFFFLKSATTAFAMGRACAY